MKKTLPFLALLLLWSPLSFAYGYAHHYGSASGMDWFAQTVVHAVIHAVVYGLVFKLFHMLGFGPSLIVGIVLLFLAWQFSRRFARR